MNANELADELESDYWDSRTNKIMLESAKMLRNQQAEIDALKKLRADTNALDKKLHESMLKANEVWGKATKSILKKAQDE